MPTSEPSNWSSAINKIYANARILVSSLNYILLLSLLLLLFQKSPKNCSSAAARPSGHFYFLSAKPLILHFVEYLPGDTYCLSVHKCFDCTNWIWFIFWSALSSENTLHYLFWGIPVTWNGHLLKAKYFHRIIEFSRSSAQNTMQTFVLKSKKAIKTCKIILAVAQINPLC